MTPSCQPEYYRVASSGPLRYDHRPAPSYGGQSGGLSPMLELGMVHVQELDAFSYVLGFDATPEVLVITQSMAVLSLRWGPNLYHQCDSLRKGCLLCGIYSPRTAQD